MKSEITNLVELVSENPDLPIYAWVNGEVCADDGLYWLGKFRKAKVREYADVESYGWFEQTIVFKDDPEDYVQYLFDFLETEEEYKNFSNNELEDECERIVEELDYRKAIFVYIELP